MNKIIMHNVSGRNIILNNNNYYILIFNNNPDKKLIFSSHGKAMEYLIKYFTENHKLPIPKHSSEENLKELLIKNGLGNLDYTLDKIDNQLDDLHDIKMSDSDNQMFNIDH